MSSTVHLPGLPEASPMPLLLELPVATRLHLRPNYADAFRCTISACEETCCQGWSVPVDQATWEKYRSNDVLKSHLGTLIVLNTSNPTSADYARMPLLTTGQCGFLDPGNLCGIQRRYGVEMLSHTCRTYPRALSTHETEEEMALNLSCPSAANLVLLDPNLLGTTPAVRRYLGFQTMRQASRLDLRDLTLLLLTDRSYPLWQRLLLLGDLTRRLQTLAGVEAPGAWVDAHPDEAAQLITDVARSAAGRRMRASMNRLAPDAAQQLQLVVKLLQLRISQPPVPPRFIECVQDFERGIGIGTQASEEGLLAAYAEADRMYLRPLLRQHPYLLENYLLNHVFKNDYPFGRQSRLVPSSQPDAEDEHLSLCIHVTLAQTLLIGMAGHYREAFGTGHVVKLIQCLARTIEHSKTYLEQIVTFVHQQKTRPGDGGSPFLRMPE